MSERPIAMLRVEMASARSPPDDPWRDEGLDVVGSHLPSSERVASIFWSNVRVRL
jgi:hypothetical protein